MIQQKISQLFNVIGELRQKIQIALITWNLHGCVPPLNSLIQLYKSQSLKSFPEAIFFCTQECQKQLWMTICCEAKDQWQSMLCEVFEEYELVATELMRGLHTGVLIHKKYLDFYSLLRKDKLKAGTFNLMGNKGAISIELFLFGIHIQIINCHLAPHQQDTEIRNKTINRILDKFLTQQIESQIFFLGDLNYRIQMDTKQYQMMIMNKQNTQSQINYSKLFGKQQLINQPQLRERFLQQFYQGKICFPPTYKMALNSNTYNNQRIPGWTDRIFAKKSRILKLLQYICQYNVLGCDHRPVLARYELKLEKGAANKMKYRKADKSKEICQLI